MGEKRPCWRAYFGLDKNPKATFLIAVRWSNFDICILFPTNRLHIRSEKCDFHWTVASAPSWTGQGHVAPHNFLNILELEDLTFYTSQERKPGPSVCPQRVWLTLWQWHTYRRRQRHTFTHMVHSTMALPRKLVETVEHVKLGRWLKGLLIVVYDDGMIWLSPFHISPFFLAA